MGGDGELARVEAADGDGLARPEATLDERPGHGIDGPAQLTARERGVGRRVDQGRRLGLLSGAREHERAEVHLGQLQVRERTADEHAAPPASATTPCGGTRRVW
jgi:hypothetical protein